MDEDRTTQTTRADIVERLRSASKARTIPPGTSLGAIPKEWPGVLEVEAAAEIARLRLVLDQALSCILGETPEDCSPEEARQDTVEKIRRALQ